MTAPVTRRGFLGTGVAAVTTALAGCGENPDTPAESTPGAGPTDATSSKDGPSVTGDLPDAIGTEVVAEGFTAPVAVEFLSDGRMLVADQAGTVHLVSDGQRREQPVLDVRDRMVSLSGYEERGLLGIALHPAYPADPRLFVRYSAPPREGTPDAYSHTFVLSSFAIDPDPVSIGSDSERILLEIPQPQANHNAGAIAFGPAAYLYVGVGDGGGANDTGRGHVPDWFTDTAGGNGQDVTENLLGSILRIDVTETGDEPYTIPDSNPLREQAGLDEHFAWGLRNPWGISFSDGELYAADVGQNRYEEVNHVQRGGNYGWNIREGRHCFSPDAPSSPPDACPNETPDGEELIDPVIEYPHSGQEISGVAVIGGYFYTGERIPGLLDRYVFADWQADGSLFVGTPTETGRWQTDAVPVDGRFGSLVLGFGRDAAGEVYVTTTERGRVAGSTGAVFRLDSA